MKNITFYSKTHGKYIVQLSDIDYKRVVDSGKWCVVIKRGNPYFQKRVDCKNGSKGRIIELHRWIMGEPEGLYVDHIDRDTLNNRRSNLRAVKNSTNIRNGRIRSNNTSGYTGIRYIKDRNKWEARIKVNYNIKILGMFNTKEEAISARKKAEVKYFDV